MPELPEVETTRRGLAPHVEGRRVTAVVLRRPDLRWPIPREVSQLLRCCPANQSAAFAGAQSIYYSIPTPAVLCCIWV